MMRRKPAACSKVFAPSRGTLLQRLTIGECAVLVPIAHDGLGERSRQPGDAGQQRRGRGVDIDAHRVHAILHHRIERSRQLGLADIMLILTDADGLRIDLHQLGERDPGDGGRWKPPHAG